MDNKEYEKKYKEILKNKPEIYKTELDKSIKKVKKYPLGYEFTINYSSIPTKAKENGLRWLLDALCKLGLLECRAIGLTFEDITRESGRPNNEETYRKI